MVSSISSDLFLLSAGSPVTEIICVISFKHKNHPKKKTFIDLNLKYV